MSNDLANILPLLLIVVAFWFLVIRPARKRSQDTARVQSSVDVGSEVMLGSGIYGTVTAIVDDTVQLEVAPGTTMKVARQAVVRVVEDSNVEDAGAAGSADELNATSEGSRSDADTANGEPPHANHDK